MEGQQIDRPLAKYGEWSSFLHIAYLPRKEEGEMFDDIPRCMELNRAHKVDSVGSLHVGQ